MTEFGVVALAGPVSVKGANFTEDGRLKTDTSVELTVDSVNMTDVSISSEGHQLKIDANGAIPVVLNHPLNSDHDEVAIGKMLKSGVRSFSFLKSGLTSEINFSGFNKIMIQLISTGEWNVSIKGSLVTNGQFVEVFSQEKPMAFKTNNEAKIITLSDIPEFLKLDVKTNDSTADLKIMVQGVN